MKEGATSKGRTKTPDKRRNNSPLISFFGLSTVSYASSPFKLPSAFLLKKPHSPWSSLTDTLPFFHEPSTVLLASVSCRASAGIGSFVACAKPLLEVDDKDLRRVVRLELHRARESMVAV
jgi:hypothetical protein